MPCTTTRLSGICLTSPTCTTILVYGRAHHIALRRLRPTRLQPSIRRRLRPEGPLAFARFNPCAPARRSARGDPEFRTLMRLRFSLLGDTSRAGLSRQKREKSNEENLSDSRKRGLFRYISRVSAPGTGATGSRRSSWIVHLPQAVHRMPRSLKTKRALVLSKNRNVSIAAFSESDLGARCYTRWLFIGNRSASPSRPPRIARICAAPTRPGAAAGDLLILLAPRSSQLIF